MNGPSSRYALELAEQQARRNIAPRERDDSPGFAGQSTWIAAAKLAAPVSPDENPDDDECEAVEVVACVPFAEAFSGLPDNIRMHGKPASSIDVLAFAKLAGLDLATGRGRSYAGCLSVQADGREMNLSWEGPA